MYHFCYKTVNLLDGRFYIGMHSCNTKEDNYLGSSRSLKLDIKLLGRKNFKVVERVYFDNREETHEFEALWVTSALELFKDKMYNKAPNGTGALFGKDNAFYGKAHTADTKLRISLIASQRVGDKNAFFGKRHTDEYKAKASRLRKGINADVCEKQLKKSIMKSTGWWCTPFGCFVSDRVASKHTGLNRNSIRNWCLNPDKYVNPNYQIPKEYHHKTWRESGFYFISKEC